MFTCPVCSSRESQDELVDEVFCVDGSYFLVGGIPAVVCARCGEQSFSREVAEKVRLTVREASQATDVVPMRVFKFASQG